MFIGLLALTPAVMTAQSGVVLLASPAAWWTRVVRVRGREFCCPVDSEPSTSMRKA
jgi:hypothetical protein